MAYRRTMLPIVIINPNSTEVVTVGMRAAVKPLLQPDGPRIECVTLPDGPPGIETDEHVARAVQPICEVVRERQAAASAFVIGCYSDPGIREARAIGGTPVFGIAESAMLTAMTRGTYVSFIEHPERPVVAIGPTDSDWTRAMEWIARTPRGSHVLADPAHAWRHGTSVRAIQSANGMGNNTLIRIGQPLRVPTN